MVGKYLLVIKNTRFLYSHFWPLAVEIQKAGWQVWIAAERDLDPQRMVDAGMKFVELKKQGGHWSVFGAARSAASVYGVLREVRPDVAHFIYLRNVMVGSVLARLSRTPAILGAITGMGLLFAQDRLAYRMARSLVLLFLRVGYRHPNAVLAVENSDDREYFVSNRVVRRERTVLIPGAGVELEEIQAGPERAASKPVILCAARMIREKGILDLVAASQIVRGRGIDFEVWLAGDPDVGNPSAISAEELRGLETDGNVRWLGHRDDVASLMGQAAVFCLPSYYREGLPRVLVEACAAGLPIVTTDVPGCREVVKNGGNGLLVKPRDVAGLAEALEKVLADTVLRKNMRIASRKIFEENFTASAVRAAFDRCYAMLSLPIRVASIQ
ncbi:MAG: glycosyltransferase family 4 protein [Acidobacteriaceae bacterium]